MKSTIGFLNNSNLHAIISTSLIIHLHGLEEISNNIVPNGSAVLTLAIIQLQALSLLQKTFQIRDQFFLYMDPTERRTETSYPVEYGKESRKTYISYANKNFIEYQRRHLLSTLYYLQRPRSNGARGGPLFKYNKMQSCMMVSGFRA
jgi:hypothetical protein